MENPHEHANSAYGYGYRNLTNLKNTLMVSSYWKVSMFGGIHLLAFCLKGTFTQKCVFILLTSPEMADLHCNVPVQSSHSFSVGGKSQSSVLF